MAFVGLSGAGKSTLLNLLCKFYAPTTGQICLDGIDILEYETHLLRRKIGLVLQKNHIFRGSLEENIRYGFMRASTEEVVEASRKRTSTTRSKNCATNTKPMPVAVGRPAAADRDRPSFSEKSADNLSSTSRRQARCSRDGADKRSLDAIKENRTTVIISPAFPDNRFGRNIRAEGRPRCGDRNAR